MIEPRKSYPVTKICTKCNEEKELEKFRLNVNGVLGRAPRCKECMACNDYYKTHREEHLRKRTWPKALHGWGYRDNV